MTREQIVSWVNSYLSGCVNEELPTVQGGYSFDPQGVGDGTVLLCAPNVIAGGREIRSISVNNIVDFIESKNPTSLDKVSFALYCSSDPVLFAWHSWNVDRGVFSL